jgi:hypothetical protein
MQQQSPPQRNASCLGTMFWISTITTRLVTLGYVALAIYAFIESRELLSDDTDGSGGYTMDGSTLYIPLRLCVPATFEIQEGQVTYTFNNENNNTSDGMFTADSTCRPMDYLINACASSLLLSAAAGILYLFINCMAHHKGNAMSSSTNGMSLFFSFLLVQAGLCTGALVEQTSVWVQHFQEQIIDKLDDNNAGIDNQVEVESYANKQILRTAAITAFGTALLIVLDAMVYRCYRQRFHEDDNKDNASDKDQTDLKLQEMETSTSTFVIGDSPPAPLANATPAWSSAK